MKTFPEKDIYGLSFPYRQSCIPHTNMLFNLTVFTLIGHMGLLGKPVFVPEHLLFPGTSLRQVRKNKVCMILAYT